MAVLEILQWTPVCPVDGRAVVTVASRMRRRRDGSGRRVTMEIRSPVRFITVENVEKTNARRATGIPRGLVPLRLAEIKRATGPPRVNLPRIYRTCNTPRPTNEEKSLLRASLSFPRGRLFLAAKRYTPPPVLLRCGYLTNFWHRVRRI